jgi:hypothetical protein
VVLKVECDIAEQSCVYFTLDTATKPLGSFFQKEKKRKDLQIATYNKQWIKHVGIGVSAILMHPDGCHALV